MKVLPLVGLAGVLSAAMAIAQHPANRQDARFRSQVSSVAIYATVLDRSGRLVTGLERGDFDVRASGRPVEISTFSNEPQPITAVLLLDVSYVLVPRFLQVRDSARAFVQALQPRDRARIGTVSNEIALSPWLSDDKALLAAIIDEELWPGGPAMPLWQGLDRAMDSLAGEPGRRVILVLGTGGLTRDGNLPGSHVTRGQLERRVSEEGFLVYGVRLRGRWANDPHLGFFARESGGGYFELAADADPDAIFRRVVEELRLQYVIGFEPAERDGRVHRLDVRTRVPGLTVRARRSYVADKP